VAKPTATATALLTPTPSPTAEPTQTPTLTPTPISVSEPCGQQLPIRLPAEQSTHEWNVPPLADNIIPNDVLPALEYFFANPNSVSLTVYRLGYEGIGFYHNADQPMPLASVSKLIELVAYANAVEAETVDPLQTVEVDDLNRYYLPRSDLGAHNASLRELDSTTLTLNDVAWMMIRHSANSASDYLHDKLGQAVIEQTAVELGFTKHSAPCPWIGRFLTMGNPTRTSSNIAAIEQLTTSPDRYANEVVWLSDQYTTDAQFRQTAQRYWANRQAPLNAQRAFIEQLETRGTTREYAHLMAQLVTQQAGNAATRELLNWPLEQFTSNSERYASIGYKNGTFPGVLTTVYYAEPYWADTPIVLALFFNDIPNRTYQGWRRSFPHDDMAHWLMSNPSAIHIMHVLRDSAEKK
ncbi:MAG: serine hydrolase, partial [Candidatus Promineifilaceae bacterium]